MSEILITRAPMGVSLQDAGRKGYLRFGIASAGPMDWARQAMANCMLGHSFSNTVIEIGPAGIGFKLMKGSLQLSFAGPRFTFSVDGQIYATPMRYPLREGQCVEIKPDAGAMWGYIGIQGAIDAPKVLGSLSENSVSAMVAVKLEEGSTLSIIDTAPRTPAMQAYIDPYIAYENEGIGIIPSSQFSDFSDEMKDRLASHAINIESRFNRMAYRLAGLQIYCDAGHDILSDGVTMGAIQVPGDGQPFVLMADHQTTGGYPKIACICKADLPRFAQMVPNKKFRLVWITLEQAMKRWFEIDRQISAMTALNGVTASRPY